MAGKENSVRGCNGELNRLNVVIETIKMGLGLGLGAVGIRRSIARHGLPDFRALCDVRVSTYEALRRHRCSRITSSSKRNKLSMTMILMILPVTPSKSIPHRWKCHNTRNGGQSCSSLRWSVHSVWAHITHNTALDR